MKKMLTILVLASLLCASNGYAYDNNCSGNNQGAAIAAVATIATFGLIFAAMNDRPQKTIIYETPARHDGPRFYAEPRHRQPIRPMEPPNCRPQRHYR